MYASAAQQSCGDQLFLGPWRVHPVDKLLNITGEIPVANIVKIVGDCSPTLFDFLPCPDKRAFSGIDSHVSLKQLGGNGIGAFARRYGIASQGRSIDTVLLGLPTFTAHRAFGGIGLNAE